MISDIYKGMTNYFFQQNFGYTIIYQNDDIATDTTQFFELYDLPQVMDRLSKQQGEQVYGAFQVTASVQAATGTNAIAAMVDQVLAAFPLNLVIEYNGTKIEIIERSINSGRKSDGFYKMDITLDYLLFA